MMSEKDVLEALNRFESRIKTLKSEKEQLEQENIQLKKQIETLNNFNSIITDIYNKLDDTTKNNKELLSEILAAKTGSSELDVDSMMTKIKENDVASSEVDEKMNEIKSERFTQKYEWGRASKRTLNLFIDFINSLWYNAPKVNNLYILKSLEQSRGVLDDESLTTFMNYLYKKGFVAKRDNEMVSQFNKDIVLKNVEKVVNF